MFLFIAFAIIWNSLNVAVTEKVTGCSTYYDPILINAVLDLEGDIYSPGYENGSYPDNSYCMYVIRAPSRHKIKLTFKDFEIEPYEWCSSDKIAIYDGVDREAPFVGSFCGYDLPNPIVSLRNGLYLQFSSDFLGSGRGYHIHYEVSPNASICDKGFNECRNRNCYRPEEKCNGKDNCGDGTDEEGCNLPLANPECGISKIPHKEDYQGVDRVIGGQEANRGSWPWQADLQFNHYYPNAHICGGTLISPQWVLTAIHCLSGGDTTAWRIHLGNHDKYRKDPNEQVRYVERLIVYPGYTGEDITGKSYSMLHDMALMKLSAPVDITDYVRPACLPQQGKGYAIGTSCVSTGWGTTRGTGSDRYLKEVKMRIHDGSVCSWPDRITMICVRNDKGFQDVCHGDSGGPLNCKVGDRWYVAGAASFVTSTNMMGGLCGTPGSAAVYNSASEKRDWIDEMIQRYS